MPVYLQRVRFSVHTKRQFLAGTNSTVKLCYRVEEKHLHPKMSPGLYEKVLDQPHHNDFRSGQSDSFELVLGTGSLGQSMGQPIPNGLQFDSMDDVRTLELLLRIEGSDQWIFDRCILGGFFIEVRPIGEELGNYEEVELGWLEMAHHLGDIAMSSDPGEGVEEYRIAINGPLQ